MKLFNAADQQVRHFMYDASATTVGGTAKLVLARSMSRSLLYIKNISAGPMWIEFDGARATATIASGAVTGCTMTNAGFNYTNPPIVRFFGGGLPPNNTSYLGLGQPNGASPSNVAQAHAVLTSNAVSSIVIDNPGSGYVTAPYVQLISSDLDPGGAALPAAGVGWQLATGEALSFNGTACPTEAISVFSASNQSYVCKWMD